LFFLLSGAERPGFTFLLERTRSPQNKAEIAEKEGKLNEADDEF
jgi:hypothetical protein